MKLRTLQATLAIAPLLAGCGAGSTGSDSAAAAAPTVTAATLTTQSGSSADLAPAPPPAPPPGPVPNPAGAALTVSSAGPIDRANAFFKPFGNGRSCATCHSPGDGWSITPAGLRARFQGSNGNDPIFQLVDGANAPNLPVATLAQKTAAYSMLLKRGVIRVGLPVPADAEFTLVAADDPYRFASASELSLFRRPLASTNLNFLSTVMFDARETAASATGDCILGTSTCFASIDSDLLSQADNAVRGHAQASAGLSAAEQRSIVDFEKGLFTAQVSSATAGSLLDAGGGPENLARVPFYFGINDLVHGDYRSGAQFNRNVFTLYGAWANLAAPPRPGQPRPGPPRPGQPGPAQPSAQDAARGAIARGEQIFNNRPFIIANVGGASDTLPRTGQRGSCASCHDTPNAGSHSVPTLFNLGLADAARRTPDMPLYTLRNKTTGAVVRTMDPGRALISGKWADVGAFKVPTLRGLAARAPYFHDGSAARVEDVVAFYDRRFRIGFTPQERADLAAFLKAL
jgi:mono/diheme cytochrome c family protein